MKPYLKTVRKRKGAIYVEIRVVIYPYFLFQSCLCSISFDLSMKNAKVVNPKGREFVILNKNVLI